MSAYHEVVVETYYDSRRGNRGVRPVAGQVFPVTMKVECCKRMRQSHPLGTKFRIQAKHKDTPHATSSLYSHHSWSYEVVK